MSIEVELSASYKARPVRGFGPIEVSFLPGGDDELNTCVNAEHGLGMVTDQFDGEYRVVYAMIKPNEDVGVYTSYTPTLARELAQALNEMADYVEAENAKPEEPVTPDEPEESLVETIVKAGGAFINLDDYMEPDPNEKNQVVWTLSRWAHQRGITYDALGFIPQFLHTDDDRPALAQIDANYQHGGGWHEANEDGHWKLIPGPPGLLDDRTELQGDPADKPYKMIASCRVGADEVMLFDCAWCAIVHPDGSMNVARLD